MCHDNTTCVSDISNLRIQCKSFVLHKIIGVPYIKKKNSDMVFVSKSCFTLFIITI